MKILKNLRFRPGIKMWIFAAGFLLGLSVPHAWGALMLITTAVVLMLYGMHRMNLSGKFGPITV